MPLNILNGSSEKVISGSSGVFIVLDSKSEIPAKGSKSSPKLDGFKDKAKAFMVKSRRF